MQPLTSDRGYLSSHNGVGLSEAGRAAVDRECAKIRAEVEAERAGKRLAGAALAKPTE